MISRQDTPFFTSVIFSMNERERQNLVDKILTETVRENKKIMQDVKKSKLIGFTFTLEILKGQKIRSLVFDSPALVYASKNSPLIFIIGPDIKKGIKEKPSKPEGEVRETHAWMSIAKKSGASALREMKKATFEGMEYFGASWKKNSKDPTGYELKSKSKYITNLTNAIKSGKGLKFLGFSPNVIYIKAKGKGEQMCYNWVHAFSAPTLCYEHKDLPLYFIAGPNIMYNDSMVRRNADNMMHDQIFGVTG